LTSSGAGLCIDSASDPFVLVSAGGGLKTRGIVLGFNANSFAETLAEVNSDGVGGAVRITKISPQVEALHRWADYLAVISLRCGRAGGTSGFPWARLVRSVASLIGGLVERLRPDSDVSPMDLIAANLDGDIYFDASRGKDPEGPLLDDVSNGSDDGFETLGIDPEVPIDQNVAGRRLEGCIQPSNRSVRRKLKYLGYRAAHPVRLPVLGAEIAHELKFKLLVMRWTRENENIVSLVAADYIDAKCRSSKEKNGDVRFADMRPGTKRSLQMYAMNLYFVPSPDEVAMHAFFENAGVSKAKHWRSAQAAPPRG